MVWFKIDDGFWSHPKVLELSDAAVALWVRAGAYCAGHLTDGEVKRSTLRVLAADRDAAVELVLAGLWGETEDGWSFHDWADYQPTREQVLAERAATRERVQKHRANRRRNAEGNDVTNGVGTPAPTRPDPTRPLSTSNVVESTLSPFCRKHPEGIDEPCRACATARTRYEAVKAAEKSKQTPLPRRPRTCTIHAEYPLPCDRCAQDAKEAS